MPVNTAEEVISLVEAKSHLRVDHDFEDSLIALYRDAAVADVAEFMRRPILQTSVEDYYRWCDFNHNRKKIYLRRPNASAVTVGVFDSESNQYVTVDPSEYRLEEVAENPHIVFDIAPIYDDSNAEANVLRISYTTGIPAVFPQLKAAVLMLLGSLYENREDVVVGSNARKLPLSVEYLLAPFRFMRQ